MDLIVWIICTFYLHIKKKKIVNRLSTLVLVIISYHKSIFVECKKIFLHTEKNYTVKMSDLQYIHPALFAFQAAQLP